MDDHCNRFPGGLCHSNPASDRRWCSYPDPACPNGYRYSDLDVGDGVSAACTAEPPARCDPTADFGEPTLVPNINSSFDEVGMSMTRDELLAVFLRVDGASLKLLISRRASASDEFPPPMADPELAPIIASLKTVYWASLASDGLVLYFSGVDFSDKIRTLVAKRDKREHLFGELSSVSLDSSLLPAVIQPGISVDGQTLYWIDWEDFRLRSAARSRVDSFRDIMIETVTRVYTYAMSSDGLTVYYSDGHRTDVIVAIRDSLAVPFGVGVPVPGVNSSQEDWPLFVSGDACWLYLASNRPGGFGGGDIWIARRPR